MSALPAGPDCRACRHFAITHVPATPYACRAMGFRSRRLPALEVLRVDGHFCRSFAPRPDQQPPGKG